MIKIQMRGKEFTLIGEVWSGEVQGVVDVLNRQTARRPFQHEPSVEHSIARYIVEHNKDIGAEIIYDSEQGKPVDDQGEVAGQYD